MSYKFEFLIYVMLSKFTGTIYKLKFHPTVSLIEIYCNKLKLN